MNPMNPAFFAKHFSLPAPKSAKPQSFRRFYVIYGPGLSYGGRIDRRNLSALVLKHRDGEVSIKMIRSELPYEKSGRSLEILPA